MSEDQKKDCRRDQIAMRETADMAGMVTGNFYREVILPWIVHAENCDRWREMCGASCE
jgi:hypothetical protein